MRNKTRSTIRVIPKARPKPDMSLKVVDEGAPQEEDVQKITPVVKTKRINRFFRLSAPEPTEDAQEANDSSQTTDQSKEEKKFSIGDYIRTTRFFRNPKPAPPEEGATPSEEAGESGEQVEKQENEEDPQKLEPEPSHPSDGRTHEPGVWSLFNNVENWVDLEATWGTEKLRIPVGWTILAALSIVGAGGWAFYQIYQTPAALQSPTEILENGMTVEERQWKRDQDEALVQRTLEEITQTISAYVSASDHSEILPHVRSPERTQRLADEYYSRPKRQWRPDQFKRILRMRPFVVQDRAMIYVAAELSTQGLRHLMLEQTDTETFKVDWESDVLYQPMSWIRYIRTRPLAAMDMRVRIEQDDHYAHAFRDSQLYQCYKITSMGSAEHLFGYAKRGEAIALKLNQLLGDDTAKIADPLEDKQQPSGTEDTIDSVEIPNTVEHLFDNENNEGIKRPKAVILRLRFLRDDTSMRGVLIDEIISTQWIRTKD